MGRLFSRIYEFGTSAGARNFSKSENRDFRGLLALAIFKVRKLFREFRYIKFNFKVESG